MRLTLGRFPPKLTPMAAVISDLTGPALVPVAVLVVFRRLRAYFPAPGTTDRSPSLSAGEPAPEFKDLNWTVGVAMLPVEIGFGFGSYQSLILANRLFAEADGPTRFQLLPTKILWIFFPLFGALSLTWEITQHLFWFGDKESASRYAQWTHEKAGFNSTRVLRWMALVIALPIAVATVLALPMRSSLRDNDMIIRSYGLRSGRHYLYSQARRLAALNGFRTREGKFQPRAEILVQFSDGFCWHSADNQDFTATVDPRLLAFLQQNTRIPLEEAQTEADLNFPRKQNPR
jgi:hypothetical protein